MPREPTIRRERPGDIAAIAEVNTQAFGRGDEAAIVDRLRDIADPFLSLVAEHAGEVVGHILFTRVTIKDVAASSSALGLGPMAVLPAHQRRGVGSALVRAGLRDCLELSEPVVVVLGHPSFYPRFGFRPAAEHGLRYRSSEYDDAFMVAELRPGALGRRRGLVEYLPPFESA
jgi:putative acetyltransferase